MSTFAMIFVTQNLNVRTVPQPVAIKQRNCRHCFVPQRDFMETV